jgi:hypothetical protein
MTRFQAKAMLGNASFLAMKEKPLQELARIGKPRHG